MPVDAGESPRQPMVWGVGEHKWHFLNEIKDQSYKSLVVHPFDSFLNCFYTICDFVKYM